MLPAPCAALEYVRNRRRGPFDGLRAGSGVSKIYSLINVPLRNSCKVCWISSMVFITKGP